MHNENRQQPNTKSWDRFKDRARDLETKHNEDCACPPNDWTVDLGQNNPKH
jgi:hypothetical protein